MKLVALPLAAWVAVSGALLAPPPTVADSSTPPQVVVAANVFHPSQAALDHVVLLVDKIIDPTSIPTPADFVVHFDGAASIPTDVEFIYAGFAGPNSAFHEPGIGFIRLGIPSIPASELVDWWSADFRVDYTPGTNPIRDRALNPAPAASVSVELLEESGMAYLGGTIDHEYGSDKILLFTQQPIDLASIPDPADFSVTIGADVYDPTAVAFVFSDLGVGVIELTLPQAVPAGTDGYAHVIYSPGGSPVVGRYDGAELAAFDDSSVYFFLPTNDLSTDLRTSAGTVSTAGGGVSESDPVATTVHSPTGGTVTISEQSLDGEAPAGYEFFGQLVEISASDAIDPAEPLVFTFDLHASLLPAGETAQTLQIFRNGTLVPECAPSASPTPVADPSPCVWERTDHATGDISITVATLQASRWNFGVRLPVSFDGFYEPVGNHVRNGAKAGSAIPLRFSLGGDRGLNIFATASPSSTAVACDSGEPYDHVSETTTAGNSSLSYDAVTDTYTYVWKTDRRWGGCRELTVVFYDGTSQHVTFDFTR